MGDNDDGPPSWISKGSGEHLRNGRRYFMGTGRAWEEPQYDRRLKNATEKARSKLKTYIKAQLTALSSTLANDSRLDWGASHDQVESFLDDIIERVTEQQIHQAVVSNIHESLIHHEVVVMVEVPSQQVLVNFRHAIVQALSEEPPENIKPDSVENLTKEMRDAIKQLELNHHPDSTRGTLKQ